MSLIESTTTPITVDVYVNNLKRQSGASYNMLKMQHTTLFNNIWNNNTFTPAEIVAQYGTDAAALFEVSYSMQQLLKQIDPTYVILEAPLPVTINADGTVTLGTAK